MAVKLTTADVEWETSLLEAVAAARTRYRAGDPHLIHPLEGLADWYAARGELLRAKPYLHEAITIRIRTWGPQHPELAAALNLLAKIVSAEGKFDKADEYHRQAVKCLLNAQPPRPMELAETWNLMAEQKFRSGNLRCASRMCRKARAAGRGRWQHFPMLALRVRNNLGAIHLLMGKTALALQAFACNFRQARKLYPPDSASLITHYQNFAEALRRQGDFQRAELLLRRSLTIAHTTCGWKHAVTASTAGRLAGLWSSTGRWTSAAKLYERVYRIRRKLSPATHADVVKAALHAAELRCAQQAWLPAEKLLEELLADLNQSGQDAPPIRALLRTRLARIYLSTARLATAERWLAETWQDFESQAGEQPLLVAEVALTLGMLQMQRNAPQAAAEFFQRALSLQEQTLGKEHLDLANTLIEQGRLELTQGESAQATALFERALSLREAGLGPKHPLTAATILDLAVARGEQQQWTDAKELGQRALAILEQNPEKIVWLAAAAYSVLSRAACELDQHDQAEEFATQELILRQQLGGPDHADLAPVLLRLGRLQRMSDLVDEAVALLRRGLTITEKSRGQYDPAVIPFLEELCSLRATDGPTSELKPLVDRYLKCHQRVYGHQSEELGAAQDQAAEWWRAAGDETQALELNHRAMSLRELSTHVFGDLM